MPRQRHLPLVFLGLSVAAACGESTGLDDVASVRLLPQTPYLDVGLTLQFEAEALDAAGAVIPDVTFTWSSSDTTVAKVTETGVAQALNVGTAAITASVGAARPASQVLIVEASRCEDRVDVVLEPGEHQAYDGDICLFLPSGRAGDRYRIAVARPTLIEDPRDVPDVWLRINPILTAEEAANLESAATAAVLAPGPSRIAPRTGIDGTRIMADVAIMNRTRRFHAELRQREQALGNRAFRVLSSRPTPSTGPALAPALVDPPVRDDLFLVLDCGSTAAPSPVVLVDFNDDVAIYQDSVGHADEPLTQAATGRMLDFYSDYVRDMITEYWGETPDVDGNGRLILTTSPSLPDSAAAAVYSGDFLRPSDCATSNQAEVMYFAAEVIQEMDGDDPGFIALSVMAHEVKHVTSLYNSLARGAFHNTWIEEGTAEISQVMASRVAWAAVGGPPVGDRLDGDDIIDAVNANDGRLLPEMWGVVSEIADVVVQLGRQPNSLITNPEGASEYHTFYAGGWHWHRFVGDAFGAASNPLGDAQLFREMTDSLTPAGPNALARVTGRSFEELFEDLLVAMSFHRLGPEPAREFTTWDLTSATAIFSSPPEVAPPHEYPWPVTASAATGNPSRSFRSGVYSCPPEIVDDSYRDPDPDARCPMGPSGIRFHDFVSEGIGSGAQVQLFGADTGTMVVTRLR